MIDHKFAVERTQDFTLNRVQQKLKEALDILANSITNVPTLVSYVVNGLNGQGQITLTPPMDSSGKPLRRAKAGSKVVAVVNLTDLTDLQTSFEQQTKKIDSIYQGNTANLSAKKLLVVLASP